MSPLRDWPGVRRPCGIALAFTLATLLVTVMGACSTQDGGNTPATLERVATAPVTCSDISANCAQQYIDRASACAQRNTSTDPQANEAARRCAVENFTTAEQHAPAGAAEQTRTDALIGLAAALKSTRDNTVDAQSRATVQAQLDQTLSRLDKQSGGHPYVQYYVANRMTQQAIGQGVPVADACNQLRTARATLPMQVTDKDLAKSVTTLRNAIDIYIQARRCP